MLNFLLEDFSIKITPDFDHMVWTVFSTYKSLKYFRRSYADILRDSNFDYDCTVSC